MQRRIHLSGICARGINENRIPEIIKKIRELDDSLEIAIQKNRLCIRGAAIRQEDIRIKARKIIRGE
ncbi:MAG: hypothetical protein ACE5KT_06240 [Methanosarcinales archaeon]